MEPVSQSDQAIEETAESEAWAEGRRHGIGLARAAVVEGAPSWHQDPALRPEGVWCGVCAALAAIDAIEGQPDAAADAGDDFVRGFRDGLEIGYARGRGDREASDD